jgi:6-phosphogluconolactonase/glucosamine-6-phosphate isomerase/deaminase
MRIKQWFFDISDELQLTKDHEESYSNLLGLENLDHINKISSYDRPLVAHRLHQYLAKDQQKEISR